MTQQTPANAAVRSTLFPGWGQWFNGEKQKGVLLGVTTLVAAGTASWLFIKSGHTYSDYSARGVPDDALYDQYKTEHTGALIAVGVASAAYLYGIVDAYVAGQNLKHLAQRSGPVLAMDGQGRVRFSYRVLF